MANLTLRSTPVEGVVVVHVDGILDATTRDQFSEQLDATTEDHGPGLVLDLGGVSFMDSRALGLIVYHWQRTVQAGGRFALINVQYPNSKVLWVTGLSQRLPMFDNLEDALASFAN